MIKKWNTKVKNNSKKEISNNSLKQKTKTKVSGKTAKKTKTAKSSSKITKWNSKATVWEKSSLKKTKEKEDEEDLDLKKLSEKWLTLKQELFCKIYTTQKEYFGNWTQAYAIAYWKDLEDKKENKTARSNSHKLLTNADIGNRITELLEKWWFNDNFCDKQLLFLMTQNVDFATKLWAIREYNKVKQRITDKSEVELKYDPLEYFKEINKREKW